jgi:phosphoglucosamine mutase
MADVSLARKYFGTDGVRGPVGETPITPEFIMRLGFAAGKVLIAEEHRQHHSDKPTVLIGKDTRISGYMLEAALEAGFTAAGVNVVLTGPLTTPGVAYLTRALRMHAGVVISASHNPYEDNGIKFFSGEGNKLPDTVEREIEAEMDRGITCVPAAQLGRARRMDSPVPRYIEFCKRAFPLDQTLRGMRIVVDCANGAGYHIAPQVFHELGAEVIAVGNTPNGTNINDGCGATHPEFLSGKVKELRADVGIALDGDGDRLIMVDRHGEIYNGDQLLYVITRGRLARGQSVEGVVGTLMSNFGFEAALKALNVKLVRAKVGDRYVLEDMNKHGWLVGGEGSGHILVLDRHTTGDAIVAALEVLGALVELKQDLAQACAALKMAPQVLINVRVSPGFKWDAHPTMVEAVKNWEQKLEGQGRVLLRPSGTEPVIRVMVEATEKKLAVEACEGLVATLKGCVEKI